MCPFPVPLWCSGWTSFVRFSRSSVRSSMLTFTCGNIHPGLVALTRRSRASLQEIVTQSFLNRSQKSKEWLSMSIGGFYLYLVDPASPRHGDVSWVGSTPMSPIPASLHCLCSSGQAYPVCERRSVRSSHTPLGLNPGNARDRSLTKPPFDRFVCQ